MITKLKEKSRDGFDWIDVSDPKKENLNEIAKKYNLHYTLIKDALQPEHLPKYEMVNDIQFIIVRAIDLKSPSESDTIQELTNKIAVFIGRNFIITIHRNCFDFLEEIIERYVNTGKCSSHFDILHRIIAGSIMSFDAPADKLIADLDYYESRIFLKEKVPSLLKYLYFIKRKASVITRLLSLSKVIIDNLEAKLPAPVIQDLRDSLTRIRLNTEQTNENVSNLLNIYISLSSQKTNEVMRVLTVFSVFFMPLTFIAGIYGMNFEHMPELTHKFGYPGVLIAMAVLTLIIYFWFKRKKWL